MSRDVKFIFMHLFSPWHREQALSAHGLSKRFRVMYDECGDGNLEWIYGYNMYGRGFQQRTESGSNYVYWDVDKSTLGQWTGLKDKNGKDIYEGDILRSDSYPFSCDDEKDNYLLEVAWDSEFACFAGITALRKGVTWLAGIAHGDENSLTSAVLKNFGEFEIVGNIHENKDLIVRDWQDDEEN